MANLKEMLSKEQKSVQYYHHMYDNEKKWFLYSESKEGTDLNSCPGSPMMKG